MDTDDLRVFVAVVRRGSFALAAQHLGLSRAGVSKRIRVLEAWLGSPLLHRTTRHVALTEEGGRVFQWAQRIIDDVEQLVQEVKGTHSQPHGSLRVSSSFGLGQQWLAPAIAALTTTYPGLQVRLELMDRLVDVASEDIDLDIRVGDDIAPHLIARRLLANHRVLCASPDYLARRGLPANPDELKGHDCLVIKERDHPFGVWRLQHQGRPHTIKVSGPLSSNHGDVVLHWALQGRGIVLRSMWQVQPLLAQGRLIQVLPGVTQPASIWAVYPVRLDRSAKLRAVVEFLEAWFASPALRGAHGVVPPAGIEPASSA